MKVAPILLVALVFVLLEVPVAEAGCGKTKRQVNFLRKQLKKCNQKIAALMKQVRRPRGSCINPKTKKVVNNGAIVGRGKSTSEGCEVTQCRNKRFVKTFLCSPPPQKHWSYSGATGPANWKNMKGYSQCGYHRQSPVDLTGAVTTSIPTITFTGYDQTPSHVGIMNNGHSAGLFFNLNNAPEMTGGDLPGTYIFHHIHFHWGSNSSQGSEHTVDGTSYPMEMHAVHYNKKYGDIGKAVASGNGDGLAVLGFLFDISSNDNTAFDAVIDGLSHIHATGDIHNLASVFSVDSLFSDDTSKFFRYNGSLTTPACNQVVVWTVVKAMVGISEAQLAAFRELEDGHHHHIVDNFRPVQPLFGRTIQCN